MDYKLNHEIYTDDYGVKRDYFSVVKTNNDGSRVIRPILPPLKVDNYTKDKDILDQTQVWTQEELGTLLTNNSGF